MVSYVCNFSGIDQLNNTIYETASSMKLPGRNSPPLIGRKFPASYLKIEQEIQKEIAFRTVKNLPPFLTKCQFSELLERLPPRENDIDSVEEEQAGKLVIMLAFLFNSIMETSPYKRNSKFEPYIY